ncbi:MAG TPA: hypothetical protein VGL88_14975 [Pseudonocardiaceae bacterium]
MELSSPDPEEHERAGPARQGSSDDTDVAFARIVASWRAGADEPPHWPDVDPVEDHFEPPEPPPFPVPLPRTVGGVLTLAVGVLLLAAPELLGLGGRVATPLGLLALTAGIGWLVIGLRPDPPPEGSDDGARL